MRERIAAFLESPFGRRGVMFLILLNAVLVGVNTYAEPDTSLDLILGKVDQVILILFTIELFARMIASPTAKAYVSDPWNVFDFIVVGACYLPGLGALMSVARTLRVLRTLRAIAVFPTLRRLVGALLKSLPGMGHVAFLLAILLYVYAVVGTSAFGKDVPEYFGTLHRTALTLFQVVTLEGWNELLFAVLEKFSWGWIYFVSFIFLGTFTLFNLFVGVIVSNLEEVTSDQKEAEDDAREESQTAKLDTLLVEVRALRQKVEELSAR